MQFPFTLLIEATCCTIALFTLTKEKEGYWRFFTGLLLLTFFIELSAFILEYIHFKYRNHWLYNFFLPIEIFFFAYAIWKSCHQYLRARVYFIAGISITACIYLFEMFTNGIFEFASNTFLFANVYLFVFCLIYYYYFLKQDEYVNMFTHPPFWIVTGLFFFYFSTSFIWVFNKYITYVTLHYQVNVRYYIFLLLNLVEYGCFSYAFIWKYKQRTLSKSSLQ